MLTLLLLFLLILVLLSTLATVGPLANTGLGRFFRQPTTRLLIAGLGIVAGFGLILSGMRGGGPFDLVLGVAALFIFGRDALAASRQ